MKNCVYTLTNRNRSVLYTGVTSNLPERLIQHRTPDTQSFTSRYSVHYLIYFEEFDDIRTAIFREKEIKNMSRAKKNDLISAANPGWRFLGEE